MTSLVRFSPSTDIRRMQREIDRLFEEILPLRLDGENEVVSWTPRVDLTETDDSYIIHVDAPGMKKGDFRVNWEDDTLTISGERKWEKESEDQNVVRMERTFGHFYRSFNLPKAVVSDKISATYKDGVLTVRVPKAEQTKPRRIEIR